MEINLYFSFISAKEGASRGKEKRRDNHPLQRSGMPNLFVSVGGQQDSIEMRYEDENIRLTQKMMATLYGVSTAAINQHIKKVYDDSELEPEATVNKYLIVQNEGTR